MRKVSFLFFSGVIIASLCVTSVAGESSKKQQQQQQQQQGEEGGGGKKPFQRLSRTLQSSISEEGGGAGEEDQESVAPDFLRTGALKALKDLINGGNNIQAYRTLTDIVDLEKAWQEPVYLKHLVTAVPMVKTIKGVGEILSKETVTASDGLEALSHFKNYLSVTADLMDTLQDPAKFAAKLQEYDQDQGKLKELLNALQSGDESVAKALQQEIVNRELGGIIDINDWGHNGIEPPQLGEMRKFVQEEAPDVYRLVHMDDPVIKKYIDDPTIAIREAKELMKDATAGAGKLW